MHEYDIELTALDRLQKLRYTLRYGPELGPDAAAAERGSHAAVILTGRLERAVEKLNPRLNSAAREQVCRAVLTPPAQPTLVEANRWLHGVLTDGLGVEHRHGVSGEVRVVRARVIDFDDPLANDFVAVQQLTVAGPNGRAIRGDLVLYINGLPLVVIELKDPVAGCGSGAACAPLAARYRDLVELFNK